MRTGVIAQKLGMTRVFQDDGSHVPVTVLQLDGCQVVAVRTKDKNGYSAVQLGAGTAKVKNTSQAHARPFRQGQGRAEAQAGRVPRRRRRAARGRRRADAPIISWPASSSTSCGTTIGKGFAGVMKRRNFGGLRATHGVSISHRSHGSTGQRQDPGKVFKGKKMAGHMGDQRVTTQNLKVVATDVERGLILIKGAVPGAEGGCVLRHATRSSASCPRTRRSRPPCARPAGAAEPPRRKPRPGRPRADGHEACKVIDLDNKAAGDHRARRDGLRPRRCARTS